MQFVRRAERTWILDVATGEQTEVQTPVQSWQRLDALIGPTVARPRSPGIPPGLRRYARSSSGRTSFASRVCDSSSYGEGKPAMRCR